MYRIRQFTTIAILFVASALIVVMALLQWAGSHAQASSTTPTPGPTTAPPDLFLGVVTAHSISLTWSDSAVLKVTAFHVVLTIRTNPALYSEIDLRPGDSGFYSWSVTFSGLAASTTYVAQVFLCDGNGDCIPSQPLTVTTLFARGGTGCTLHGPPPICQ
jgi:hypothetical protein